MLHSRRLQLLNKPPRGQLSHSKPHRHKKHPIPLSHPATVTVHKSTSLPRYCHHIPLRTPPPQEISPPPQSPGHCDSLQIYITTLALLSSLLFSFGFFQHHHFHHHPPSYYFHSRYLTILLFIHSLTTITAITVSILHAKPINHRLYHCPL